MQTRVRKTLLVDSGFGAVDISAKLNLKQNRGLSDLIQDHTLLSTIVSADNISPLHIVSAGNSKAPKLKDIPCEDISKIYAAWSAVYEVVIVCCSNDNAFELYKVLGAEFEAGLFVQKDTTNHGEVIF